MIDVFSKVFASRARALDLNLDQVELEWNGKIKWIMNEIVLELENEDTVGDFNEQSK